MITNETRLAFEAMAALIDSAVSHANEDRLESASVSAQIATAQALMIIAAELAEVIGESKSGRKFIRTYDQSPSSII